MPIDEPTYAPGEHPELPPPPASTGFIGWLRANLFSSIPNAILTIVCIAFLAWIIPALLNWGIFEAVWTGTDRDACIKGIEAAKGDVACWIVVKARLNQFIYYQYPIAEQWRPNLIFALFVIAGIPLLMKNAPFKKWCALFLMFAFPVIAFFLLTGGVLGLEEVETSKWGGLMLTLVIAITGIAASLPLGILLALGRRSQMPMVKSFCIVFIEFWRGVPLITVLFMASVMFPLFLPEGVTFNQLLRALIGIAFFASAYMAEVIRGGLQALPKGQYEAAAALGLNYTKSMRLIILPQALKTVIPGIVNTFIGLFKDTTLVLIIGLFDFLGAVDAANRDAKWAAPNVPETLYVFAALVYFVFCYGMSSYSVSLEKRLATGHKR